MSPRAVSMLVLLMLGVSCARPKPEAASPPRIKDSPPEQGAALRAADPRLRSEDEENRWGIEGARERKRQEQQRAAGGEPTGPNSNGKALIPMPPPNGSNRSPDAGSH